MQVTALALIQIACFAAAILWWHRRQDVFPVLVASFFLLCGSFRAAALQFQWAEPVNLGVVALDQVGEGDVAEALKLMTMGEIIFLFSYAVGQRRVLSVELSEFPEKAKPGSRVLLFFMCFCVFPLAFYARSFVSEQTSAGKSLAFEVTSYATLLPMAVVGLAILIMSSWRFRVFQTTFQKILAGVSLVFIAWFTFGPSLRFLFLGWVLAAGVIWAATARRSQHMLPVLLASTSAVLLLGLGGAMRSPESRDNIGCTTLERIASAEDANMLDGFVMLRKVFPDLQPYSHGREHLNILFRPIPRALWKDKPVGGYMNQLHIFDAGSTGTVGISPTLFGSFYQEGGVVGVVILSSIYGVLLGSLLMWISRMPPFASVVFRAAAFAGLVPILRGGDLAGAYAWLGMSFWPCAVMVLFLWPAFRARAQTTPNATFHHPHDKRRSNFRELRPVSRFSAECSSKGDAGPGN